jgi:hypothetical protein
MAEINYFTPNKAKTITHAGIGGDPAPAQPPPPPQFNFQDVLSPIQQGPAPIQVGQIDLNRSRELTQQALGEIGPTTGIRPEFQDILAGIEMDTAKQADQAASRAQALAVRRGVEGSTIEQFGVQEGAGAAEEAGRRLSQEVKFQNVQLNQLNSQQRATLLSTQAGLEAAAAQIEFQGGQEAKTLFATLDQNNRALMATLSSDELASVRNLIESNKDRELQKYLGERGISVSQDNVNAAREDSKRRERGNIISTAIAAPAMAPF